MKKKLEKNTEKKKNKEDRRANVSQTVNEVGKQNNEQECYRQTKKKQESMENFRKKKPWQSTPLTVLAALHKRTVAHYDSNQQKQPEHT
jgi:ElaB/YqjD/DUF883 family membrane-anchored ribosome-binding protein